MTDEIKLPDYVTGPRAWILLASLVLFDLGATVKLINELFELWIGNRERATWIYGGVCYVFIFFSLGFIGFRKRRHMGRKTPLYPKVCNAAKVLLTLLIISTVVFGFLLQRNEYMLRTSRILLVADFEYDGPDRHGIKDKVVVRIDELLSGDRKVVTRPLEITVPHSDIARALGHRYNGNVIVWGRVESKGAEDWIYIGVERLSDAKHSALNAVANLSARSGSVDVVSSHIRGSSENLPALTLYVAGVVRYESDEHPAAIAFFTAALSQGHWQQDPLGRARLMFYRGNSFLFSNKLQEAIADYSAAIEADPNFAQAYFNRAFARSERGDNDGAVQDYTAAIRLASDEDAFNNRGVAYAELARANKDDSYYELAIKDYSEAIKINSAYSYAFYNQGDAYSNLMVNRKERVGQKWLTDEETKQRYEEAITSYTNAINIDPHFEEAYNNRADAHRVMGRDQDAISDYSEAIRINPNYHLAWYNRGNVYFALKEHRKALNDYTQAVLNNPANADYYYNRGNTYAELAETETDLSYYTLAINDYKEALKHDPDYINAYYNRAETYILIGHTEEATADFKKILELSADVQIHRAARLKLWELGSKPN